MNKEYTELIELSAKTRKLYNICLLLVGFSLGMLQADVGRILSMFEVVFRIIVGFIALYVYIKYIISDEKLTKEILKKQ